MKQAVAITIQPSLRLSISRWTNGSITAIPKPHVVQSEQSPQIPPRVIISSRICMSVVGCRKYQIRVCYEDGISTTVCGSSLELWRCTHIPASRRSLLSAGISDRTCSLSSLLMSRLLYAKAMLLPFPLSWRSPCHRRTTFGQSSDEWFQTLSLIGLSTNGAPVYTRLWRDTLEVRSLDGS